MDKYIAAAKVFWETFANAWVAFFAPLSKKDSKLFGLISDLIDGALKIERPEEEEE